MVLSMLFWSDTLVLIYLTLPLFLYTTLAEELRIDRFEDLFLGLGQRHRLNEFIVGLRIVQVHSVH